MNHNGRERLTDDPYRKPREQAALGNQSARPDAAEALCPGLLAPRLCRRPRRDRGPAQPSGHEPRLYDTAFARADARDQLFGAQGARRSEPARAGSAELLGAVRRQGPRNRPADHRVRQQREREGLGLGRSRAAALYDRVADAQDRMVVQLCLAGRIPADLLAPLQRLSERHHDRALAGFLVAWA